MINTQQFLLNNIKNSIGSYALVSYDNIIAAIWFSKIEDDKYGTWFLESPCELFLLQKINGDIDEFCKEYVKEVFCEDNLSPDELTTFINNNIKPFIKNNYFYEIENFQIAPYLPKEVKNISLISEEECFNYLINSII